MDTTAQARADTVCYLALVYNWYVRMYILLNMLSWLQNSVFGVWDVNISGYYKLNGRLSREIPPSTFGLGSY